MNTFEPDQQLKAIYFPQETTIEVGGYCDEIRVIMEPGQMARVPWAGCWKDGKMVSKFNLSLAEGVAYQ